MFSEKKTLSNTNSLMFSGFIVLEGFCGAKKEIKRIAGIL
jgi:hypothetical protein